MTNKVVLAYSGGLDTSIIIPWLRENHGLEVHCLAGDVGQGADELTGLEDKAIQTGAASCRVEDLRREFLEDYVWPCLRAMTVYEGRYLLGTSMARPILAKAQVDYAREIGATFLAHGCTGKGNDQVRFDVAVHALDPKLEVVAPMRVGMGLSRDEEIDYAIARDIDIPITRESPYSIDVNLWGRSCETGVLEDPWTTPPADAYEWTVAPSDAPDIPTELTIGFEGGIPISLDGEALGPVDLVQRVHDIGGVHGVGRIDHVEDRLVGIKSREIYETPAATILHTAHASLEGLTFSKEQLRFNRVVADETAQATYDGIWFSALHRDLREYTRSSQRVVNGQVRMRLEKGNAYVVGRRSDDSLYDRTLATYDADDAYDHAAAVGFIKIFGMPLRSEAARHDSAWTWTEPMLGDLPVELADAKS